MFFTRIKTKFSQRLHSQKLKLIRSKTVQKNASWQHLLALLMESYVPGSLDTDTNELIRGPSLSVCALSSSGCSAVPWNFWRNEASAPTCACSSAPWQGSHSS